MKLLFLVRFMTLLALGAGAGFTASSAQDAAPVADADAFFFHDGDIPIVFLGDSITEQHMYSNLLETYLLSRYPDWKITFRNAGIGGDTAWLAQRGDFDAGFQRDLVPLQPKAVTIDFGMNDARGGDGTYPKYLDYTTKLVKGLVKLGTRVALITPSPEERYEPDAPAGSHYNVMLKKYIDGLKLVADNEKVPLIDQFTPFVNFIEAGRKAGVLSATEGGPRLTNEGVHPNWGGHLIMATAILQGFHAPAEVSSVTVDAAAHSITASSNCTVEWQDAPGGAIQIKRADRALPWPLPDDPMITTVLKIPGFDPMTELNQYMLKVTGLKEANYKLSIDGIFIANYSASDLANGVNLATVRQGPIYDQEQKLFKAVTDKNGNYMNRWRNIQLWPVPYWLKGVPGIEDARKAEEARCDGVVADLEKSIETLRMPMEHTFRLDPVK